MPTVRRNSRVRVPTKSGGETWATTTGDVHVEKLKGRLRRALAPFGVVKKDHRDGGSVEWTMGAGTIFKFFSRTRSKE